ncbi:MAG: GNAT family N-acetyltransferase [Micropruina sp.]|uniref:GNAT family N-acetyltransferase n=1 Tax=Micropruina sp. TaxID=2737536 RepID=UPI0039E6A5E3
MTENTSPVRQAATPGPLPEGVAARPAASDDVPAILELLRAEELAGTGETSLSAGEIAEWFDTPRARERNTALVLERDGVPIGVWRVFRNFDDRYWAQLAIDRSLPSELVDELWRSGLEWTEQVSLAVAAGLGVTAPRLDIWVNEHDALTRRHAEASGFQQMRAFIEMHIDLAGYVAPEPNPQVLVRQAEVAASDSPDLATMYAVITESFRDHYDFQLRSFDDWAEARRSDPLGDPSHWYLAEIDGEVVGGLIGHNSYLEADDAGYVANLGVLRQGRGRGVAKALLHTSLARYAADGRVAVKLHVDAESPTGATHLYESVGMHRRLVGFDFHKHLGVRP